MYKEVVDVCISFQWNGSYKDYTILQSFISLFNLNSSDVFSSHLLTYFKSTALLLPYYLCPEEDPGL